MNRPNYLYRLDFESGISVKEVNRVSIKRVSVTYIIQHILVSTNIHSLYKKVSTNIHSIKELNLIFTSNVYT